MKNKDSIITHHPNNVGKKFCAQVWGKQRTTTGWGDSEEQAIASAKNRLDPSRERKNK